jgi:hypothetical protein
VDAETDAILDRTAIAIVRAGKITPMEYEKNKGRASLADLVRIRSTEPIRPLEIAGR